MSMRTPFATIIALLLTSLSLAAVSASAQSAVIPLDVRPTAGLLSCRSYNGMSRPGWDAFFRARRLDGDRAKEALERLQDSVTLEAEARPADVRLQYLLAVIIGSRTDVEGGRESIRLAESLHRQAAVVLALDPKHPGAHHLLGRLNAAILRMDGFARFVATRVLGADQLAGASWEEARLRLEAAVVGDPCVPDYHYELARLYAERGDRGSAVKRLRDVLRLAAPDGPFADVHAKGATLLARLEKKP